MKPKIIPFNQIFKIKLFIMKTKTMSLMALLLFGLMLNSLFSQDFIRALQVAGSGPDFIHGVTTDNQGNIIIDGTFQYTVDFDPSNNNVDLEATSNYDIYLAKYSPTGDYIWAKHMGGAPDAYHYSSRIRNDQEGNTYITGFIDKWLDLDPSEGEAIVNEEQQKSIILAKYNSDGEYIWGFALGSTNGQNIGWDVEVDDQENCVYLTGTFGDTIDFDPSENTYNLVSQSSNNDFFIAKYTLDGQFIWAKDLGFQGYGYGDPRTFTIDEYGNIYIAGSFSGTLDMDPSEGTYLITTTEYNDDVFLAKYNSSGEIQWAFSFGGEAGDVVWTIRYYDQKIYTVGSFYGTVDFDPSEATFEMTTNEGEDNGFLAVYNDDGTFQTAMGMIGTTAYAGDRVNDLGMDTDGNIYLLGSFYGTIDVDPSDGVQNITSTSNDYDMFLSKYSADGDFNWVLHTDGNDQEQGILLQVIGNSHVIAYGFFDGNCDFDPSSGSTVLYGKGSHDVYMAWYSSAPESGIAERIIPETIKISPDPATYDCKVQLEISGNSLVNFGVTDLYGKEIFRFEKVILNQGMQEIKIPSHLLSAGAYLVWEETSGKRYVQKLIKLDNK